jgi:hypothetical protein
MASTCQTFTAVNMSDLKKSNSYLKSVDQQQLKIGSLTEHPEVSGQRKVVEDHIENPENQIYHIKPLDLKGLSHEIDFTNVDKNVLGLSKGRGWFLNFLGAPMIM